ncbi:hypothetical protein ACFSL4_33955 [Streptomyces caeni]|uniref:Uncharacterized protein n=1 Tax=Streptomyces caeni TaxID=2307231 RepID=A0ABW4J2M2_9ACTN
MSSSAAGPATGSAPTDPLEPGAGGILRQPKAVWATAGALVILVRRTSLALPHTLESAPAPAGVPVSPGRR